MTNFFEHQRIARKKSRRVLLAFFILMFVLLYVFNFITYLLVGATSYGDVALSPQYAVYTQPLIQQPSLLEKAFFINPQTANIQWTLIVLFVVVFMGGFFFKLLDYRSHPESVVQSMVFKQVKYGSPISEPEKRLLNIVEEMCIAAGIPIVKTFVLLNEKSINAFTAGHDLRTAHIAVTQGALDALSRDEMQAVIAHEIGHIVSADVKVNSLLFSSIFSMTIIMITGQKILRSSGRTRSSSSSSGKGGGGGQIVLLAVALICIGALGAFCGRLLQSMFSRKREFLADSLSVQFTRNPEALASALAKIRDSSYINLQHFEAANISHMCFVSSIKSGFVNLLATHPPINDRIKLLHKDYLNPHPEIVKKLKEEKNLPKKEKVEVLKNQTGAHIVAKRILGEEGLPFDPFLSYVEGERILGRLQKTEVETVLHKPEEFKYAVWALFIASDSQLRERQIKILEAHYGQWFSKEQLEQCILDKEDRVKLANSVISIAMAQMQNLSKEHKDKFLESVQELILADQHISALEQIIYSSFLANNMKPDTESRMRLENIRSLLFLFAELSGGALDQVEDVYQKSLESYFGIKQQFEAAPDKMDIGTTVELLRQLRAKSDQTKQEVLHAIGRTMVGTDALKVEQFEAFRAVSMALGIPSPPASI